MAKEDADSERSQRIQTSRLELKLQLAAGYFDESTDEGGENLCYVVGGFIGSQHATAILDLRWQDALRKYELDYFKASELNAGEGQFKKLRDDPRAKGWRKFSPREKEKFDEIKTHFTNVFLSCRGLYGIGAAVILPDYKSLRDSYLNARNNLTEPYYLCSALALTEAGQVFHKRNQSLPHCDRGFLRPIFDSHQVYGERVKLSFDSFCKKNPVSAEYLLPPLYESELDYISLQAADNLAFEIRKFIVNKSFKPNVGERVSIRRIKEQGKILIIYKLDYEGLKKLADAQEPDSIPIDPYICDMAILEENDR